jgi:hypothetical protein
MFKNGTQIIGDGLASRDEAGRAVLCPPNTRTQMVAVCKDRRARNDVPCQKNGLVAGAFVVTVSAAMKRKAVTTMSTLALIVAANGCISRQEMARSQAETARPRADRVGELINQLKDMNPDARRTAAIGLVSFKDHDPREIEPLIPGSPQRKLWTGRLQRS